MIRGKLIFFVDRLFISSCLFLLLYAWINFYIRNLVLTFFISLILTISISIVVYSFLSNRAKSKKDLSNVKIDIDKNYLAFSLLPIKAKAELLKTILDSNYQVRIQDGNLYYTDDNKNICITFFTRNIQNTEDLIMAINELTLNKIDKVIIVCSTISKNINTNILKNMQIEIVDKTKLYSDYFLKSEIYPDKSNLIEKSDKISIAEILTNILSRQKAKGYFIAGLVLTISSILIPFRTYYLVCASIFLILAIACKIIPLIQRHRSQ